MTEGSAPPCGSPEVIYLSRYVFEEPVKLWKVWGIQLLLTLSLFGHLFLTVFGKMRKHRKWPWLRFLIWAAYLFSTYVATITLGKLTTLVSERHTRILGMLAPVLLIHLGNPDSITSYSIYDKHLGFRQLVNIAASIALVVWVFILWWQGSYRILTLYMPLFLAGLLTAIGWLWCLSVVYDGNSIITYKDMDEHESSRDIEKAQGNPYLRDSARRILRAFYRFDCLKPHIPDWPYHPGFVTLKHTKIDEKDPKEVFDMTEMELSFMYDVLYTKAPILYTRVGIISRFLVFLSLASAITGFSLIFQDYIGEGLHISNIFRHIHKHIYRHIFPTFIYVMYIYVILIAVLAIDLYQTVMIPISDWAVVTVIRKYRNRLMLRIICYVADICIKQRKWSGRMGQLNLFEYCCKGWFSKLVGQVLWFLGIERSAKQHWALTNLKIPDFFKTKLHEYMKKLEEKRNQQPFNKRGDWSFEIYEIQDEDIRSSNTVQGLDKSIITWHIATEVCLHQLNEGEKKSERYRFLKMISEYMIYLVEFRSEMLSQRTAKVTMGYTCKKMRDFLRFRAYSTAIEELSSDRPLLSIEVSSDDAQDVDETIITSKWDVLSDARRLGEKLRSLNDEKKWEFMSSMWVEMLCYAAYNCHAYRHSEMLTYGGELITHVWLILLHNTDKYQIKDKEFVLEKLVEQKKKKKKKMKECLKRIGNILGTTRQT